VNQFNGERALEYARSRHSTSDFARSLRQQQIIKAVMDKIISKGLLNITRLKQLYADYTKVIHTNISLKEMLGMAQYMYKPNHILSYEYTTECSNLNYKYSAPGCFLYTPSRDLFGGASVMIPDGSTP
jgi:anionic cell wall polymer biosynthesis LytR-Cps2A-Psr (LCP) family protein